MAAAEQRRSSLWFMYAVAAVGGLACVYALTQLPRTHLDERFFLLALATICIGSRLSVKMPGVTSQVTVSETFIFLTLLLFGTHAAVVLATCEGLCTSLRFSRKRLVIVFNMGAMACSWALTSFVVYL